MDIISGELRQVGNVEQMKIYEKRKAIRKPALKLVIWQQLYISLEQINIETKET